MTTAAAGLTPPRRYDVPTVKGSPDATRRLAAAYRDLAESVTTAVRTVTGVVHELSPGWQGAGAAGIAHPVAQLGNESARLVRVLDQVADHLDAYATKLEHAQHHHHFSIHKLVAVGAVVVVSATAIVVTMGAATVVEAAAATAAVTDATEAAGTAAAASAGAAAGLADSVDVLASLRPLLQFALPHLLQVEWSDGAVAAYDEATRGRLDWKGLGVTSGLALTGSAVAGRATAALDNRIAAHAAEATVWGGMAAADDEILEGRFDATDVVESFVLAGAGVAGRDALVDRGVLPAHPDYRRAALIQGLRRPGRVLDVETAREMASLRQPLIDFQDGHVDLGIQEGPGHTVAKHIGRPTDALRTRIRTSRRLSRASSFWTDADAHTAVQAAIRQNRQDVDAWLAGSSTDRLRLRATLSHDLGMIIDKRGKVVFVKTACVILTRDAHGVYVLTSYPETRPCR